MRDAQEQTERMLKVFSLTDELTGLYNRRGFLSLAEQQLKIAERMNREMLLLYGEGIRIGIFLSDPKRSNTVEQIIAGADTNMYDQKREKQNYWIIHSFSNKFLLNAFDTG